MLEGDWVSAARASYDRVAPAYADLTRGALDRLPVERSMLEHFAQHVRDSGGGPVVDAGCGPGWLTSHLAARGLEMVGLDVSGALVDIARSHQPALPVLLGSITAMPFGNDVLGGAVCWYVLHHVPDADLPGVLAELARILRPGGRLLLGGHAGVGSSLKTAGYGGAPMQVLVNRRDNDVLSALLRDAGFRIDALVTLEPDQQSPTGIILAST